MSQAFHTICYRLAAGFSRLVLRMASRLQTIGLQKKDVPPGPYIFSANHSSHFDPFAVAGLFPRKIDFMATWETFFENPLIRLYCWACDIFPVRRDKVDRAAIREALRRLKQGRIVGVFPDGGLRAGKESILGGAEPKPGAAMLAQMANVPVRVCLVIGGDQLYCWRNLFRRVPFYFKYGPELKIDSSLSPKGAREKLNREIAETLRALYREFLDEVKPSPEVLPLAAQERWKKGR